MSELGKDEGEVGIEIVLIGLILLRIASVACRVIIR